MEGIVDKDKLQYYGDIHASKAKDNSCVPGEVIAVLLYGSWNTTIPHHHHSSKDIPPPWVWLVHDAMQTRLPTNFTGLKLSTACVQVDDDDISLDICIDEFGAPSELPAIMLLTTLPPIGTTSQKIRFEHIICDRTLLNALLIHPANVDFDRHHDHCKYPEFLSSAFDAWSRLIDNHGNIILPSVPKEVSIKINGINNNHQHTNELATRIFIAGDRSQVGKSSICLGLLGTLLNSGKYQPDDLAYIKPATQCEQTQLVEEYCKYKGISACIPIGPIVYYKGFTRSFIKGEVGETSEQLLQKASDAVDNLAVNKKVIIIDGVGYPAVGSITGTDNASVAKVCGRPFTTTVHGSTNATVLRSPVPVVIVGKSGVGDAVDSFNINATYFAYRDVPVIGAIFNKLSLDGYYSLSNCKEAIDLYFNQVQPDRVAFGFIPEIPSLTNVREQVVNASNTEQSSSLALADLFVVEFSKHVNVDRIISMAKESTANYIAQHSSSIIPTINTKRQSTEMENVSPDIQQSKLPKSAIATENSNHVINSNNGATLTREQIEALALVAGASGG
jgi:hypothetical protein